MILCGRINRIYVTSATHKIRKSCATHRQHLVLCWVSLTIQWFDTVYFMVTQMIRKNKDNSPNKIKTTLKFIVLDHSAISNTPHLIINSKNSFGAQRPLHPTTKDFMKATKKAVMWIENTKNPVKNNVCNLLSRIIHLPTMDLLPSLAFKACKKKTMPTVRGSWFNFSFASEATYVPQFPWVCFNVHLDPRVV